MPQAVLNSNEYCTDWRRNTQQVSPINKGVSAHQKLSMLFKYSIRESPLLNQGSPEHKMVPWLLLSALTSIKCILWSCNHISTLFPHNAISYGNFSLNSEMNINIGIENKNIETNYENHNNKGSIL